MDQSGSSYNNAVNMNEELLLMNDESEKVLFYHIINYGIVSFEYQYFRVTVKVLMINTKFNQNT